MARNPYTPIERVTDLRPAAQMSDNYVQPARSGLQELAQSLTPLSQELNVFLQGRARKKNEDDRIRGEAAFYTENADSLNEAVRTGKVPPQYSPAFMAGFNKSKGSFAGTALVNKFAEDFAAWDGKNSDDPQAFDVYVRGWIAENAKGSDPDELRALMPHINKIVDGGSAAFVEYRGAKLSKDNLTLHVAQGNQAVDDENAEGLATGDGTNYPRVFDSLDAKRAEYAATGKDPAEFDKAMMDALGEKILMTQDAGLLGWFERKVPGESYTYGDTPYGLAKKQQLVAQLEVVTRQRVTEQAALDKKELELKKDETQRQAIELIMGNPSAIIPPDLLTLGSKYDPTFPVKVAEWRKNLAAGFSDPKALQAIQERILAGEGFKAISDGIRAGVFGRPEDLAATYTFLKGYEGSSEKIKGAMELSSTRELMKSLEITTKATGSFFDPITGLSKEGMEAQYDFRRMVQDWVVKNPDAGLVEQEEFIARTGRLIMDRIKPAEGLDAGGTYERPGDLDFANPFTAAAPEGSPAAGGAEAPQAGGAEADNPDAIQQPTEKPSPTTPPVLTPAQRKVLEKKASDMGMDADTYINTYMGAVTANPISFNPNDGDAGDGDMREAGFTSEQASGFLDEAVRLAGMPEASGNPSAVSNSLLDLIGRHESKGNYNAVFGNADATRDLGAFTLDQILSEQQAARRAGAVSTAIGKHQFIYKTLRSLKDELGLSGSEKFTPELQDRLGLSLLERRGLNEFLSGKISKRAFAFNLSQEWASLANPNTGRSYYAGDGINRASATSASVYRAMGLMAQQAPATQASLSRRAPAGVSQAYANIPDTDSKGAAGQLQKFMEWNPDPIGNHATLLAQAPDDLQQVVKLAQTKTKQAFVVGSGKRDAAMQKRAVEWGWSKTMDSDHNDGNALDLWPLDANRAVDFDKKRQKEIVRAMREAAKELGVELDVGEDFGDLPHFAVRPKRKNRTA